MTQAIFMMVDAAISVCQNKTDHFPQWRPHNKEHNLIFKYFKNSANYHFVTIRLFYVNNEGKFGILLTKIKYIGIAL